MIGLEGSGFTICLGVILLLTGMVMYYCKCKITQCESKLSAMTKLVTGLHEEINILKQQKVSNYNNFSMTSNLKENEDNELNEDNDEEYNESSNSFLNHPYQELIPDQMNKEIHTINESSESEDDTSDEEEGHDEIIKVEESVKVVDLGEIENLDLEKEKQESEEEETDEESEDSESSQEKTEIDYSKMQVSALKKLATERQLAPNVHKLRKKELVTLLQA